MNKRSKCCGADAFKWTMEYNKDFESIEGIAYRCTKCQQWCETITPKKTIAEVVEGWPKKEDFVRNPSDYQQGNEDGEYKMLNTCEDALRQSLIKEGYIDKP